MIHSNTWKNRMITIQSAGRSANVRLEGNHGSRWFQMWKWDNGYLVNDRGKVLAILNKQDSNGSNMGVQNKNGEEHQQWELIYADELPAEPKKGEMNKDFGFRVDIPF
jgi:hypothetical protein